MALITGASRGYGCAVVDHQESQEFHGEITQQRSNAIAKKEAINPPIEIPLFHLARRELAIALCRARPDVRRVTQGSLVTALKGQHITTLLATHQLPVTGGMGYFFRLQTEFIHEYPAFEAWTVGLMSVDPTS